MYVFFHFVLRRIDLQCWERMRFLFCSRCWKIFEFLDKLSKNICIFKRKKRGFWMIFIGMEWVDCCCCGVGWFEKMKKTWKNVYFWRGKWKVPQHGANFLWGRGPTAFFVKLFFAIFQLWFCVSSLLQCSLVVSRLGFFTPAISCFFAIFASFERFGFLHHEQLR